MRSSSIVSDADGLLSKRSGHQLPGRSYVTLSEALSWLAFGISLTSEALSTVLEFGSTDAKEKARAQLVNALDLLADIASDGRIRMRGKFVSHPGFGESRLSDQEIPAVMFHDFARFDVLSDGLSSGSGLAWSHSSEGMDTASRGRPDAAYRWIKVNRDDLLAHTKNKRASPYKTGQPPDRQTILDKADEMRARGMDGREISSKMQKEPGFESAYTTLVRETIKGVYPRGPRKKAPVD